jgi:hypothetical protein
VLVLLVGLPALKGWVDVIKGLLEWMGITPRWAKGGWLAFQVLCSPRPPFPTRPRLRHPRLPAVVAPRWPPRGPPWAAQPRLGKRPKARPKARVGANTPGHPASTTTGHPTLAAVFAPVGPGAKATKPRPRPALGPPSRP